MGYENYEVTASACGQHGIHGTCLRVADHGQDRPARNLTAVRKIIEGSALPDEVRAASLAVFERLAHAEAKVHGTTIDEVHFHEVGAFDSLVDIVGFAAGTNRLGVARLYASPLPLGSGTIRTEHGLLPVPAPATLALLASAGSPNALFTGTSRAGDADRRGDFGHAGDL